MARTHKRSANTSKIEEYTSLCVPLCISVLITVGLMTNGYLPEPIYGLATLAGCFFIFAMSVEYFFQRYHLYVLRQLLTHNSYETLTKFAKRRFNKPEISEDDLYSAELLGENDNDKINIRVSEELYQTLLERWNANEATIKGFGQEIKTHNRICERKVRNLQYERDQKINMLKFKIEDQEKTGRILLPKKG